MIELDANKVGNLELFREMYRMFEYSMPCAPVIVEFDIEDKLPDCDRCRSDNPLTCSSCCGEVISEAFIDNDEEQLAMCDVCENMCYVYLFALDALKERR